MFGAGDDVGGSVGGAAGSACVCWWPVYVKAFSSKFHCS